MIMWSDGGLYRLIAGNCISSLLCLTSVSTSSNSLGTNSIAAQQKEIRELSTKAHWKTSGKEQYVRAACRGDHSVTVCMEEIQTRHTLIHTRAHTYIHKHTHTRAHTGRTLSNKVTQNTKREEKNPKYVASKLCIHPRQPTS